MTEARAGAVRRIGALVHAWLVLDFFGESRRSGQPGSTLTTTIFGQSFFGLAFAALTFPDRRDGSALVAYAAANLSLSTLLMGIGAALDPRRLERVRADEVLVRTAPVGRWMLALARALHGGFALSLVTIGIALPPAILSYWVAGGQLAVVPAYLLVACVLAAIAAGALAAFVGWIGLRQGQVRAQLAGGTLRGLLLAFGFVGFALCLRRLRGTAEDLPGGVVAAHLWPPYWGARWLRAPLAGWAYGAALAVAAAFVYAAGAALQRAARPASPRVGRGLLVRLDRWLAPPGPLRGVVAFTSAMLYRSPGFRARVLPIFGLPAAMIGLALWEAQPQHGRLLAGVALQLPAIYVPLLVAFLPQADQAGSAWIFAQSPLAPGPSLARRAALVSLTTHVLLPAHLVALGVLLASRVGLLGAVGLACFSLGVGIAATAVALQALETTPFTDEEPGVAVDAGGLMGFALVLSLAGGGYAAVAGHPAGAALGVALLGGATWLLPGRPWHGR